VSLKSAFHTLLEASNLPGEVKHRIREEVEVKDVPDTVPDEPKSDEKEAE
jgi:hypothetical protein